MNNLVIVTLIATLGLGVFLNNQHRIRATLDQANAASAQLQTERAAIIEAQKQAQKLERIITMQREANQKFRAEVNNAPVEPTDFTVNDLNELEPEKEGIWPKERPYFYLSKQRLQGLAYSSIARRDKLSEAAIALFGLSPDETAKANNAFAGMLAQFRDLENAAAIPTNTPAMLEKRVGEKISVFLGAISKEDLNAARQQFRAELNQAVGQERGGLLWQKIEEDTRYRFRETNGRTFTLIRDGESIRLIETDGHGSMMDTSSNGEDGRDEIPPQFRHLFPEN